MFITCLLDEVTKKSLTESVLSITLPRQGLLYQQTKDCIYEMPARR